MTPATQPAPRRDLATIRGLTIHQPWAWLIAKGHKSLENRTWSPPREMVGQRLAIHAGKHWDPEDVFDILTHLPRGTVVRETLTLRMLMEQLGHIVAVARIAGTVTRADLRQMAERDRPWFVGPVGWVLDSVTAIEPVQCKGAQGLWTLPPDVLAQVRERYAVAGGVRP